MRYEFHACLFDSRDRLLDEMFRYWLTADGNKDPAQVDRAIFKAGRFVLDPERALADKMIDQLGLNKPECVPGDEAAPSHMEKGGYTRDDLIEAARRFIDHRWGRKAA